MEIYPGAILLDVKGNMLSVLGNVNAKEPLWVKSILVDENVLGWGVTLASDGVCEKGDKHWGVPMRW